MLWWINVPVSGPGETTSIQRLRCEYHRHVAGTQGRGRVERCGAGTSQFNLRPKVRVKSEMLKGRQVMSAIDAKSKDPSVSGMMRAINRIRQGGQIEKPSHQTVPQAEPSPDRWPLPGLAPMTKVRTSFGDVHAVALRKGDLVETRSGEFKPIVWLNRVLLDQEFLNEKTDSNPIRIQAGSVGQAIPASDILVSPRQVVIAGKKQRCEASDLIERAGVDQQRETGLSYTMFHLGDPEDVYCDGIYLHFEPLRGADSQA